MAVCKSVNITPHSAHVLIQTMNDSSIYQGQSISAQSCLPFQYSQNNISFWKIHETNTTKKI